MHHGLRSLRIAGPQPVSFASVPSGRGPITSPDVDGASAHPAAEIAASVSRSAHCLHSRFLEGLSGIDRKSIVAAGVYRRVPANYLIANQEDPADRLFLLIRGRGRYFYLTEDGRKIILHWILPGDILGGAALLPTAFHYLVGAEMVRDGWCVIWDRSTIRSLAANYPKLVENTLAVAIEDYLAWYVTAHAALTCEAARDRLARVLVALAHRPGDPVPDEAEVEVTNEELASASNITPFTASRLLNEWQRAGLLSKTRGRVLLHSPKRLVGR